MALAGRGGAASAARAVREGRRGRLWAAELRCPAAVLAFAARHGWPIRYARPERPLEAYQTVFATEPGSAEMPSAARPFTARS